MPNTERSILIVEDDINDQTFIQRALKRCGVTGRVCVVNDGEEATAFLRGVGLYEDRTLHPLPRLVITDVKMPRMGGIELLGWMNARAEFRLIPTIILTSSSDRADIGAAFSSGAKGYMIKPVQFGELETLMRTIVEYWRASALP
ncbi:MAG TPA: response regulator [Opitutaceae bacterium]|nr:response regulator [Opitutaceae bacterium]